MKARKTTTTAPNTAFSAVLDQVDRDILGLLADQARMSFRELGEHVSLSANAVSERVRRLEARGVIAGYRVVLGPAATVPQLVALVDVRLGSPDLADAFEQLVAALDGVTDCAHVTGRFDYALRIAAADTQELDRLIRVMKTKGGVIESDTRIVLRPVVTGGDAAPPLP